MTLTDFLLARIAEDEARVDTIPDWYCTDSARGEGWGSRGDCPLCDGYMFDGTETATKDAMWEHMEDVHRRTRMLAECDAKQAIVHLRQALDVEVRSKARPGVKDDEVDGLRMARFGVELAMKCLALPYADHPDYREEWRP